MDHVAIMRKEWGLLPKILTGEKQIESRWYKTKRAPWNTITAGDIVYFKNSGEPVSCKATVEKVLQFAGLTPSSVRGIIRKYCRADGIEPTRLPFFSHHFQDKKYCILIFLKYPVAVRPFTIDKSGFGAMAAWLTAPSILSIARRRRYTGHVQ